MSWSYCAARRHPTSPALVTLAVAGPTVDLDRSLPWRRPALQDPKLL